MAASSAATSVPSEAAISEALASRKSPARIALRLPQRALTLSTPRRVSASSITSSWHSEPTCTSSTETPPRITSSVTTAATAAASGASAAAEATVNSGRARLPPALMRWPPIWAISSSSAAVASWRAVLDPGSVARHPGELQERAVGGHGATVGEGLRSEKTGRMAHAAAPRPIGPHGRARRPRGGMPGARDTLDPRIPQIGAGGSPCSNGSPTEPDGSSCWPRRKLGSSTTTTSAPSTSCSG